MKFLGKDHSQVENPPCTLTFWLNWRDFFRVNESGLGIYEMKYDNVSDVTCIIKITETVHIHVLLKAVNQGYSVFLEMCHFLIFRYQFLSDHEIIYNYVLVWANSDFLFDNHNAYLMKGYYGLQDVCRAGASCNQILVFSIHVHRKIWSVHVLHWYYFQACWIFLSLFLTLIYHYISCLKMTVIMK